MLPPTGWAFDSVYWWTFFLSVQPFVLQIHFNSHQTINMDVKWKYTMRKYHDIRTMISTWKTNTRWLFVDKVIFSTFYSTVHAVVAHQVTILGNLYTTPDRKTIKNWRDVNTSGLYIYAKYFSRVCAYKTITPPPPPSTLAQNSVHYQDLWFLLNENRREGNL